MISAAKKRNVNATRDYADCIDTLEREGADEKKIADVKAQEKDRAELSDKILKRLRRDREAAQKVVEVAQTAVDEYEVERIKLQVENVVERKRIRDDYDAEREKVQDGYEAGKKRFRALQTLLQSRPMDDLPNPKPGMLHVVRGLGLGCADVCYSLG